MFYIAKNIFIFVSGAISLIILILIAPSKTRKPSRVAKLSKQLKDSLKTLIFCTINTLVVSVVPITTWFISQKFKQYGFPISFVGGFLTAYMLTSLIYREK